MSHTLAKVSVIVPCYNSVLTIDRCLKSILAQTHPVLEILVYDDCSTDGTAVILVGLADVHPQIRVIFGEENKGAGFARTTLLKAAQGDFFAFLDADDVWYPTKLEVQLNFMHRHAADICSCDYDVFDTELRKLGTRRLHRSITKFQMHLRNEIALSMSLIRGDLKGCREMPVLRKRQDYAYWLRIFALNPDLKCVTTPEVLGGYYRTPGSLSSNMMSNLKANYAMFRETQKYSVLLSLICICANMLTRIAGEIRIRVSFSR